jgi:hypothetical protein
MTPSARRGGSAEFIGHHLSSPNLSRKSESSTGVTYHYHGIVTDCISLIHSKLLFGAFGATASVTIVTEMLQIGRRAEAATEKGLLDRPHEEFLALK